MTSSCSYTERREGVRFVCELRAGHRGDHVMWRGVQRAKKDAAYSPSPVESKR